jgi:hypothetical protein
VPTKEPDRRERLVTSVEPSSGWLFVAIALGGTGCYAALAVHLILDATGAGGWRLVWMAVPGLFFAASVAALFTGSGVPVGERIAAIPAALLGYSPRSLSRRRSGAVSGDPT